MVLSQIPVQCTLNTDLINSVVQGLRALLIRAVVPECGEPKETAETATYCALRQRK